MLTNSPLNYEQYEKQQFNKIIPTILINTNFYDDIKQFIQSSSNEFIIYDICYYIFQYYIDFTSSLKFEIALPKSLASYYTHQFNNLIKDYSKSKQIINEIVEFYFDRLIYNETKRRLIESKNQRCLKKQKQFINIIRLIVDLYNDDIISFNQFSSFIDKILYFKFIQHIELKTQDIELLHIILEALDIYKLNDKFLQTTEIEKINFWFSYFISNEDKFICDLFRQSKITSVKDKYITFKKVTNKDTIYINCNGNLIQIM